MGQQEERETGLTCEFRIYRDWPTLKMGQSFGLHTRSLRPPWIEVWRTLGLVMVVMVMMRSRGERRGGEHQDQEHGSKDLLHGENLARGDFWRQLRPAR